LRDPDHRQQRSFLDRLAENDPEPIERRALAS
jgi:hypothetical protein